MRTAIGASSTRSAFAARYASTVPWNSRCSLVTVVTTPTSKRQLRVRPNASAWDVASMTTLSLPARPCARAAPGARAPQASCCGIVGRQRVVQIRWTRSRSGRAVPPTGPQHLRGEGATVDLPSVPVTPMTVSCSERASEPDVGGVGQRTPAVRDHQLRDAIVPKLSLDHYAPIAPLGDRLRSEVMPVDVDARNGEEERAPGRPGASRTRATRPRRRGCRRPVRARSTSVRAPSPMCAIGHPRNPAASRAHAGRRLAQPVEARVHDEVPGSGPMHLATAEALLEEARRRATGGRVRHRAVPRPTGRDAGRRASGRAAASPHWSA